MNTTDPAQPHGAHRRHRRAHPSHRPRPRGLLACVRALWTVVRPVVRPVVGPVYGWAVTGPPRGRRAARPLTAPA
ncbi:hypothetical protein ACFW3D_26185 [Streptomyces sp. NPDC058864]